MPIHLKNWNQLLMQSENDTSFQSKLMLYVLRAEIQHWYANGQYISKCAKDSTIPANTGEMLGPQKPFLCKLF